MSKMRLLVSLGLLLLSCVHGKERSAAVNNEPAEFCLKYAECRRSAKVQMEKCTGGFVQLFLNEHGTKDSNQTVDSSGFAGCKEELAHLLDRSIHKEYDRIEQVVFQCVSEEKSATPFDKTQEAICEAAYNELHIDGLSEVPESNSTADCQAAYAEHLERCELVQTCCPRFAECQKKAEIDSGIHLREKMIAAKFEKCIQSDGNVTVVDSAEDAKKPADVDVRFAPRRHRRKHRPAGVRTATPVPRVRTNVINGHGRSLIHKYRPTQPRKVLHVRKNRKGRKGKKSKGKKRKGRRHRKIHRKIQPAVRVIHLTTEAAPTTSPAPPSTRSPAFKAIETKRVHQSVKNILDEQRKQRQHSISHDIPALPLESAPKNPSPQEVLNKLLCTQYIECESVLEKREQECAEKFAAQSEHNGIEDPHVRALFVNNSKTSDPLIRHECMKHVDAESQRHLVYLKNQKDEQDRDCAMSASTVMDSVELEQCQEAGALTEFSKLDPVDDHPLGSLESCRDRLSGFRKKCNALRACCPNKTACERTNRSPQARKLMDITAQLKMEQTLCEKRLTRVHDGLIVNAVEH